QLGQPKVNMARFLDDVRRSILAADYRRGGTSVKPAEIPVASLRCRRGTGSAPGGGALPLPGMRGDDALPTARDGESVGHRGDSRRRRGFDPGQATWPWGL